MRKTIIALSALVVGLIGAGISNAQDACQGGGNIVANCGFETGDFTGWSGTTTTDFNSGVDGLNPYSGNYEAYLGTLGTTSTLSQTLATVAGDTYAVSFFVMNDTDPSPGYDNSFTAYWDGNLWATGVNVDAFPYEIVTEDLTATGSSTLLSFVNENDGGYWSLDSISVVDITAPPPPPPSTPEPGSIALLGTSLLGVAAAARRRLHR